MHISVSITVSGTVLAGTLPLIWGNNRLYPGGNCEWDDVTIPVTLGTVGGDVYQSSGGVVCNVDCTVFIVYIFRNGGAYKGFYWFSSGATTCLGAGTPGSLTDQLTLGSYTCNPLSMPFTSPTLSFSGTLTL